MCIFICILTLGDLAADSDDPTRAQEPTPNTYIYICVGLYMNRLCMSVYVRLCLCVFVCVCLSVCRAAGLTP